MSGGHSCPVTMDEQTQRGLYMIEGFILSSSMINTQKVLSIKDTHFPFFQTSLWLMAEM